MPRLRGYLLAASPLLVAVLVYGYTIRLPFFLDDGPNFHLVEHIDGLEQWGGTIAFDYYRPFAFTVWKLGALLAGHYDPVGMHLLNVFCFGLTGVLTGQIARRILGQPQAGWIAGWGFVLFPFSYQAVTLVSGLFHLLFALGLAFSAWLVLRWLDGHGGWWTLGLCWLTAFLGMFSHENAPLLPVLVTGVIGVAFYRRWPRRIAWVVVPLGLLALTYLLLWFTLPRNHGGDALIWSQGITLALGDLVQGLAYPVVAVAAFFVDGQTVNAKWIIVLVAAVILPVLIAVWWRSRPAGRAAAVGLGWYGVSLVPSTLLLGPDYVLGSPRLMLVASIGASLFWAAALPVIARWVWARRAALVTGLMLLLPLAISLNFLSLRRHEFLGLGRYTWRLFDLLQDPAFEHSDVLLVNAPNYIAPREPVFLLGAEGATFMLNELSYNQQMWLNTGIDLIADHDTQIAVVGDRQTLKYPGEIFAVNQAFADGPDLRQRVRHSSHIIVTYFDGDRFLPVVVGGANLPGSDDPLVEFPDAGLKLTELEATLEPDRRVVVVHSRWQMAEAAPVKLFVHVMCNGTLLGQSDGYVWGDTYPFSLWTQDDIQTDRREVWLDEAVSPDCLQVYTGVYWETDGTRLAAFHADDGARYDNDVIPVPFGF